VLANARHPGPAARHREGTRRSRARAIPYFVERKLYPNVDFYSGIIYRAMGIPLNMFTVLFAIGRMPGWIAHWYELRQTGSGRIYRPRQIYQGSTVRTYEEAREADAGN
jgi:citrate synthase